jgi:hypothetical protein
VLSPTWTVLAVEVKLWIAAGVGGGTGGGDGDAGDGDGELTWLFVEEDPPQPDVTSEQITRLATTCAR